MSCEPLKTYDSRETPFRLLEQGRPRQARVKHYNSDAEKAVLGAILDDPSTLPKVLDAVNVQDFHFETHRATLRAFIELQEAEKPADPVLLSDVLSRMGKVEDVHLFVSDLMDKTPSPALVGHYCRHIKEKAVTRDIIETTQQIQQRANEATTDVDGLLSFAQQSVMGLSATNEGNTARDMRTLARTAFEAIEERINNDGPSGITTGFKGLDQLLGGLRPGLFYPVAGRPGTGKTAIALNIARVAAEEGKTVVFFSLEMPSTELTTRLISSEAGIDGNNFNRGYLSNTEWEKVAKATETIARLPIFIDDATLSIDRIATRARRYKVEAGLDLVIVDYLQLVPPSRRWNTREQEVSEVSRTLKAIAKELNVPVIAGAQLNRNIENRTIKTPTLADLRESGAIEQDADAVIFIVPGGDDGGTELVVEKNRQGPTGSAALIFDKKTTTFKETPQRVTWNRKRNER